MTRCQAAAVLVLLGALAVVEVAHRVSSAALRRGRALEHRLHEWAT